MYCKNCNKKGKIGDIYCSECGSKLERKKIDFTLSKKSRNILISTLATILIILITYKTIDYIYSPSYIAKKYFEAVINNDTSAIYSYLAEDESTFVSEDILKEKMTLFESVSSYKIVNIEETDTQALVEFEYTIDGETATAYVLLNLDGNNFYIFDNWEVSSAKLVEDVTIEVPAGSEVTIDDQDITDYLVDDDNDYYDIYEIPYMISGDYAIKSVLNGITVEDEITATSNKTYYIDNVELDDTLVSSLEENALSQLNYIYSNAISGTSFDDINSNFTTDNNLKDVYKSLKTSFKNSSITVNSVVINDIEETSADYDDEGNLVVTYETDYDINYTYTLNGTETTTDYESTSKVSLVYIYVDGNFVLYDISNTLNLKVRW